MTTTNSEAGSGALKSKWFYMPNEPFVAMFMMERYDLGNATAWHQRGPREYA